MAFTTNTLEAARWWVSHGFWPVPIPSRSKKPEGDGWPDLRIDETNVRQYFNGRPLNIGVLLGDKYNSADVDLDCPEALAVAHAFLPPTGMIFGRKSKPASHWIYRSDPAVKTRQFKDGQQMLVELRGRKKTDGHVGLQTVVPPSLHAETGEVITFRSGCDRDPANIDAPDLVRAVSKIAAAALLVRYWPKKGSRHDAMLALAGVFARAGWLEKDAVEFCRALYTAVPTHDPEQVHRSDAEVRDSYHKFSTGLALTGFPTLIKLVDENIVKTAAEWLELPKPSMAASTATEPVIAVPEVETLRPDMSEEVLDGKLGEIFQRRMKGAALAYAWGPLVTIAGVSENLKRGQSIRGNLFWCSVGDVGTGKSAIFEQALHVLGVSPHASFLLKAKYGSAEGLVNDLKESCVRLLAPDELAHLLRKCAIEHSGFPTFLTTAFYQDQQRGGTKKDRWEIDCRLSIAGGVVEDDFGDAFGAASVSGLYDRFLFGLCPQPYEYDYYPLEGKPESISAFQPDVDPDVWEVRKEWAKSGIRGRIAENCLRVAYICAAVDGRPTLRGCDLGPAFALAKYQLKVRDVLQPNPGQNPDAQCAISVKTWLRQHAPHGEWIRNRTLGKGIHSERLGPGVFHRCLQNLQMCDDVELDLKRKIVRLLDEDNVGTLGDTSC